MVTTPQASAATTRQDEATHEPSRGITFDETRYSNHKYLVADDDREEYQEGALVYIGSGSKVYGPYRLGNVIAQGAGKKRFIAFKEGTGNTFRNKPKTKADLEAEAITRDAVIAELRAKLAKAEKAEK